MKRCKIELSGKYTKSGFSINLVNTAWFSLEGNWNCLPGFMPVTGGYFTFDSEVGQMRFYDCELTTLETVSAAVSDAPMPHKLYMSLKGFTENPGVGTKGTGNIFGLGSKGKPLLTDQFGIVWSEIEWQIKEVV